MNNYGPKNFRVYHDDGSISLFGAVNKKHLRLLLRIELNLDWIRPVKNIVEQTQCELPWVKA